MEAVWRLGGPFALLAVGAGARRGGPLDERRTRWLTGGAFYVALPALVFTATYDRDLAALVQVPMTVLALVTINDADAPPRDELAELATNPVLWALVAGLAGATVGLSLPNSLAAGLGLLGRSALPLALLGVGASLRVDPAEFDPAATGAVVALKVAVMPALAWVVFSALGVSATVFGAVVVLFGMPSAVSTYVYASELGGDARFASVNVFATTVASLGTVVVVLGAVG